MPYSKDKFDADSLPDEEVLRLAQKDPDLFAILVRRHEAAFMRKAKNILWSEEEAVEAVQDTFTRIYLYADKFNPVEGAVFTSWAYAILVRLCYTRYGKLKRDRERREELEPEAYERIADTADFLEDLSVRNEVLAVLSRLPETASRILRFQFIEGKSQEEIALLEGSTVPAVKTRVHRAKKLFKQIYDRNR
jgi:RNA polymerase sigma-70 factor (ECF subfamily)